MIVVFKTFHDEEYVSPVVKDVENSVDYAVKRGNVF